MLERTKETVAAEGSMRRTAATLLAGLAIVVLFVLPAVADEPAPRATIHFLIDSSACPCVLEACARAAPLGDFVEVHLPADVEFKKYDYAFDSAQIEPLLRQYKIFTFPALIVLDREKKELAKFQGPLDGEEVLKKLRELKLITGEQ
jgi:hypothetical protein